MEPAAIKAAMAAPEGGGSGVSPAEAGRGDRLALLRLYDEMDDAGRQEVLRLAVRLRRQGGA